MIYDLVNKKGRIGEIDEILEKMIEFFGRPVEQRFNDIMNRNIGEKKKNTYLMDILPNVTKSYLGILKDSPLNNTISKILKGNFLIA